jgi:hypothetical protein
MDVSARRKRLGLLMAGTLGLAVLTACGSDDEKGATTTAKPATASTITILPGQTAYPTAATVTVPPGPTAPASTTKATVIDLPDDLVTDCVAYIQYGTLLGNTEFAKMWENAGQDPAKLREACEEVGQTDIQQLQQWEAEWQDIQTLLNAATSTTLK